MTPGFYIYGKHIETGVVVFCKVYSVRQWNEERQNNLFRAVAVGRKRLGNYATRIFTFIHRKQLGTWIFSNYNSDLKQVAENLFHFMRVLLVAATISRVSTRSRILSLGTRSTV